MDRVLGLLGAAVLGCAAYVVLMHPRWLVLRARGVAGRPTRQQLDAVQPADLTVVRVVGVGAALLALGLAVAALAA